MRNVARNEKSCSKYEKFPKSCRAAPEKPYRCSPNLTHYIRNCNILCICKTKRYLFVAPIIIKLILCQESIKASNWRKERWGGGGGNAARINAGCLPRTYLHNCQCLLSPKSQFVGVRIRSIVDGPTNFFQGHRIFEFMVPAPLVRFGSGNVAIKR